MRIGFFTDGFLPQPNGVATSVFETARELEARGHEVFIIAPKYPGYIDRGLNVIRIPSLKIAEKPETRIGISLPDKHLAKILSLEFDIIHGHSGGPVTLLGWEISRGKNIPCVVTYHTLWNRYTHYFLKGKVVTPKMMERATQIFGNRVDYLIAPTERVEKELKRYGVKKPVGVVPSGINIDKFSPKASGILRKKLKLAKNIPLLLFVGRLGSEKSVDFIIRSFKKVIKKNNKAHLAIVGDGPERKKLEILAKKLDVGNIHFTGEIDSDKMNGVYSDATVFVFSSITETQGLVVPEALASGVPVVAINDPAYEIVSSGENGFLVKKDENVFAEKILSIINKPELHKKMSEAAVESAKKLSVKTTVDSLESVYLALLEKHNKESVGRFMAIKERSEAFLVLSLVYWVTVIITRSVILLTHTSFFYPRFNVLNQHFHHASIGFFLVLLFFALFVKRRKVGLLQLIILGTGVGFIADDIFSTLLGHIAILDYWNPLNLAVILIVGILPLIFMRGKNDDRPRFYISTRVIKHVNPPDPKITVVVPAYNEGNFIEPTLKSLLNQTYKDFELIVVDNASSDNTAEIAASYGAKVVLQKVKGVAAARQKGFMAAKGEVIASTDADSIVPENWVATILERYKKNQKLVGFGGLSNLYSGSLSASAAGRYLFPIFWKIDKIVSGGWNMSGFNMSVRRSAFKKIGGFNESLKMGEDIDLSEKLRTVGKVDIDLNLIVFSSGRRYAKGLLPGLSVYAPWWISKVVLRREKPFEFPAVRSEKGNSKDYDLLPLSIVVLVLCVLFYLGNMEY